MHTFLSALPVLAVIVSLLAGISALRAAWLGLAATLLAVTISFPVPPEAIWPAILRWTPIVLEVLLIIGGGLWMSQVLQHSGAQAELARWIRDRAGPGIGTVLLIVHGITPFAESMTGFGIGITIGIPLLAHAGLAPRKVALLGLLGLSTVPWGSMGPGTLIGANMAGLGFYELGMGSALYSIIPFIVPGVVAAWLVAAPQERLRALLLGTGSSLLLSVVIGLSNWLFGTAPAGALGSSLITLLYLGLGGRGRGELTPAARRCLLTYALLLGGVLAATLCIRMLDLSPSWRYVGSPALWLFVATAWFTRGRLDALPGKNAWHSWQRVAPVTGLFILVGIVMAISGMATYLAHTLAEGGRVYLGIGPFVGAVSGFITGSTSGANAMLATTQAEIARALHVDVLAFLSIHNVAAAFLLMASPSKVELAVQLAPQGAQQELRWVQVSVLAVGVVVVSGLAVCGLLL